MENQSINGQFWHWDFGVNSQLNDTSDLTAPTWTYADTGSYVITLIANPGWPCADTSTSVFEVHPPLDPYFERPPIRCTNEMAELVVQGIFTNTAAVSWDFGDGASPVSALGHIVSTEFAETGAHPITVSVVDFGCEQSYTDSVVVYPRPQLTAVTDRAGCAGVLFAFEAEGIAWTAVSSMNFGVDALVLRLMPACWLNSVVTPPGYTSETSIPQGLTSRRKASENPCTACLVSA